MPDKASKSLRASLLEALELQARGKRAFRLNVLRSQPKRSHTLFPWASDASVKIYVEYETIILSEKTGTVNCPQTWVFSGWI
jgi:regulator of Ty1 transposition protein 109